MIHGLEIRMSPRKTVPSLNLKIKSRDSQLNREQLISKGLLTISCLYDTLVTGLKIPSQLLGDMGVISPNISNRSNFLES